MPLLVYHFPIIPCFTNISSTFPDKCFDKTIPSRYLLGTFLTTIELCDSHLNENQAASAGGWRTI